MKILVISLAGIGDTLIGTPLIHELRGHFPEARLEALVLWAGAQDLLHGNPHLDCVHQHNFLQASSQENLRLLLRLRREHYDVSVNVHPQSKIQYRIVARLIGARQRLSHQYDNASALDRLLVNRILPQDYAVHSVENNLRLLGLLGRQPQLPDHRYELFLTPEERQSADAFVATHQLAGRRLAGFHVGSGRTKNLALRRWPLEHYLALLRLLAERHPELTLVLFGGPEEAEENERLHAAVPQVLVARTRTVREAIALVARCECFVSVDTSLMHFAAAMRVPRQIVIESPALIRTHLPFGNDFRLVRNPAVDGRNLEFYRHDGSGIRGSATTLRQCMASITVDAVYQTFVEALNSGPTPELRTTA